MSENGKLLAAVAGIAALVGVAFLIGRQNAPSGVPLKVEMPKRALTVQVEDDLWTQKPEPLDEHAIQRALEGALDHDRRMRAIEEAANKPWHPTESQPVIIRGHKPERVLPASEPREQKVR